MWKDLMRDMWPALAISLLGIGAFMWIILSVADGIREHGLKTIVEEIWYGSS